MKQKSLAKLAAAATAAALLATGTFAFAQTMDYGTGGATSGSAGTVVPTPGSNDTPGITNPGGTGTSATNATGTTPGVPNTGNNGTGGTGTMGTGTPGVPNTGVGDDGAAMATLAVSGVIAAAAAVYLLRRYGARVA